MGNKLVPYFLGFLLTLLPLVASVAADASYSGPDQLVGSPGNTTYLIDPAKGDDANAPGKAWRTFGRLNGVKLAPGDTVIIAPGRQEETLKPSGGGSAEKPVVIRFQPGVHTFGIKNVIRLPMFVCNSMDSTDPKPVGIYLENARNFHLEGGGVDGPNKTTILYDGRMVQIFNDHSENISFSGLVFDLKRPTVSEFRVLESSPSSAVIQVAEGADYAVENGKFVWKGDWGQGYPQAIEAVPDEGRCQSTKMPRGWNGAGQTEAKASDLGARKVRLEFASEGTGLTTGHQYQFRLIKRDVVAVHNARSKDIAFRDCDFYALPGMGFVSQFTENITYQRVNVAPPKETLRTCAAWADIFHFSNCKGDILVDSCRLSGMQDDALNCHGTHLRIVGKPAENQLLMRFMQGQTFGFAAFQPGDEVAVINHNNLREYAGNPRRKVTAVERINDKEWLLTLDAPAPAFEKDDVLDNLTWYPNLTARNNHISMDSVRGFLITTRGKILVENNTFHRPAMAGILIEDDASGWFESGPIRDMLIRNNRFVRCGIAITPHTKSNKPGDWVHENIRIEENEFYEDGNVSARNVKGLTFINNRAPERTVRLESNACTDVKQSNTAGPLPLPPLPTAQQLAWQRMEQTMFFHFGVNTFSDREWGDGKESEQIFKPTSLDCRQWVRTAKAADFKLLILTAKHHDGFCLWPTKLTEHCVRNSPWKDGKGDVVREFTDACHAEGVKVGLYLSPWDRNNPAYGSDAYNEYFVGQLTELLTHYGPVDEVWFDGACGEGPNGKKQVYDWKRFFATIHKLAPNALVAVMGPDIRWVGNEAGIARADEHSARHGEKPFQGYPESCDPPQWWPAECDVSIRPGWFHHAAEDGKIKSLDKLVEIYFKSVGRNSVLLLNVPPDRRGLLADADVKRLGEFGEALKGLREGKLAPQAVSASTFRSAAYAPAKAADGDLDTAWATDDATKTGWLEIDFGSPRAFNVVNVQELLPLGERVTKYRIDAWIGDKWLTLARGSVIGQRNLHAFPEIVSQKLRLVIEDALACPAIAEFGAHLAPETPARKTFSLTAYKPTDASDVHANDTNFGADKAVDDDLNSRWGTNPQTRECWLEVDLLKSQSFSRLGINEFESRITRFQLEYRDAPDQPWRVAYAGTSAGKDFKATFAPVTARWVRLHILKANWPPSIYEFGVFKE